MKRPGKSKNNSEANESWHDKRIQSLQVQSNMQLARTKRFQAETKLKELKIAQIEGAMIDKDAAIREQYQRETSIKKAFIGLGREIATKLVGKGPLEIESIITEKVCEIMRELAVERS